MAEAGRLVVVLSPENSGSSLVAAVLGGGAGVLAPPETHLFRYPDYEAWRAHKPQAIASLTWLMEALKLPATELDLAARFGGKSPHEIYTRLLELCGPSRMLVEKTPAYARELSVLREIERFEPEWIWLVRHPLGVLASNIEGRARRQAGRRKNARTSIQKLTVALRHTRDRFRHLPAGFEKYRLDYWYEVNARIESFLAKLPSLRVRTLHYERLVRNPVPEIEKLCADLKLEFESSMLQPNENVPSALTWGLGNEKVAQHTSIDASGADRWRETLDESLMSQPMRAMLERLEIG